jgi:ATP-dependent DNA ligase
MACAAFEVAERTIGPVWPSSMQGREGYRWPGTLMSEMHWTRPELVAQIESTDWTSEGRLRQAALLRWRHDTRAEDVRREVERLSPAPNGLALNACRTTVGRETHTVTRRGRC